MSYCAGCGNTMSISCNLGVMVPASAFSICSYAVAKFVSALHLRQVSATGADAFSRRKTQSKVYWSTVPKAKRDELQAAAAAAGTTVQVNADGTAVLSAAVTGRLLCNSVTSYACWRCVSRVCC